MAAVAIPGTMAEDGIGPQVPSPAELPVSEASAATAGSRAGRYEESGCRAARGSAPSRRSEKISLQPAGVLRTVPAVAEIAWTALLFVLVPQGITSRSAA